MFHGKTYSIINVKVKFGEREGKVSFDSMASKYIYIAEVKRDLGLLMYDTPNVVEELKHPTAKKQEQ